MVSIWKSPAFSNVQEKLFAYRDQREKISAGVRLLYLFSSRSIPIGGSRFNKGLRLLAAHIQNGWSGC